MSWSRLSDDYSDDCWTLSDVAFRLHTEAIVWSGRKLLNCRIPRDDVRRFARHGEMGADELVERGFWCREGDVYVIVHHAGYQRTAEEVIKRQQASAANGRRGGRPPSRATRDQLDSAGNLVANPAANLGGTARQGMEEKQLETSEAEKNFGRGAAQDQRYDWASVGAEEPMWRDGDPDYPSYAEEFRRHQTWQVPA